MHRFYFLVRNIVQCSETNKKSIFRFLVFEKWSLNLNHLAEIIQIFPIVMADCIYGDTPDVPPKK